MRGTTAVGGSSIAAKEVGLSRRATVERFGIGIATAIRWVRAFCASGSIQAAA